MQWNENCLFFLIRHNVFCSFAHALLHQCNRRCIHPNIKQKDFTVIHQIQKAKRS